MPIYAKWLLEGRIIYSVMEGEITLADIQRYDDTLIEMMLSATGITHNIVDIRGITRQANLKDIMRIKAIHHPNSKGWGITIGAMDNGLARMLTSIIMSLAKARYRDMKNMEEALKFLQDKDISLPDLKPLVDKVNL